MKGWLDKGTISGGFVVICGCRLCAVGLRSVNGAREEACTRVEAPQSMCVLSELFFVSFAFGATFEKDFQVGFDFAFGFPMSGKSSIFDFGSWTMKFSRCLFLVIFVFLGVSLFIV